MFDLNPVSATLAKAHALGVALPTFPPAEYPALFNAWADRVAQADMLRARGQLTDADLDECDRQLGIPASRVKPKVFVPPARVEAPGWLASFAADPMDGLARAMRAITGRGEDAGASS